MIRGALLLLPGLVFLIAGAVKLWDPRAFQLDLQHHIVPAEWLTATIAVLLPWLEILAAGALILPRWRRPGLLLMASLLMLFIPVLLVHIRRGQDSCGCFGMVTVPPLTALIIDGALLGLITWLLVSQRAPDDRSRRGASDLAEV